MLKLTQGLAASALAFLFGCGGTAGVSQASITTACAQFGSTSSQAISTGNSPTLSANLGFLNVDGGKRFDVTINRIGGAGAFGGYLTFFVRDAGNYALFLDKDLAAGVSTDKAAVTLSTTKTFDSCPAIKLGESFDLPAHTTGVPDPTLFFRESMESSVGLVFLKQ